jgi:hypothetical protein
MADTFTDALTKEGITWSMEVTEKATATLIDQGEVFYPTVRYTFVDANKVTHEFEASTWCPEITGLSNLPIEYNIDVRSVVYAERDTTTILEALPEGEKIGTIETKPVEGDVSGEEAVRR